MENRRFEIKPEYFTRWMNRIPRKGADDIPALLNESEESFRDRYEKLFTFRKEDNDGFPIEWTEINEGVSDVQVFIFMEETIPLIGEPKVTGQAFLKERWLKAYRSMRFNQEDLRYLDSLPEEHRLDLNLTYDECFGVSDNGELKATDVHNAIAWLRKLQTFTQDEDCRRKACNEIAHLKRLMTTKEEESPEEPQPSIPQSTLYSDEKVQEFFRNAIDAGFITETKSEYKWNYTNALLAFFCGKIYCGDCSVNGKRGKKIKNGAGSFQAERLEALFNVKNLARSRVQNHDSHCRNLEALENNVFL